MQEGSTEVGADVVDKGVLYVAQPCFSHLAAHCVAPTTTLRGCCVAPPLCVSVCAVCGVYNHDLVFDGSEMKMGFTAREAINKGKSCDCHVTAM